VKDYSHFSASDFAMDENFRAWVWKPTGESNAYWRDWIARHPDKAHGVEEAIALLKKLSFPEYTLSDPEISMLWEKIALSTKTDGMVYNQPPARRWWLPVAAAVAAVFIGIVTLHNLWTNKSAVRYETAYGETRVLLLPDSSTVILNANSSIAFTDDWNTRPAREVWLEGEAFFEVVHTRHHQPFQVKVSNGLAVEVLGTSFNVYHRKADTKVVLNSGQIALSFDDKEEKILMQPGELVEYNDARYSKRNVDPTLYAAWTEKKAILDETSLREMIKMAKEHYGISVRVQSEHMMEQTVSGSMPLGDAESFVLQVAKAFQLKAEKRKDHYLLKE
jgi:transmembrane sensor